jgi:arylsulfatase A-like enzyme
VDFALRPSVGTVAFHDPIHAAGAYVSYWLSIWAAYLIIESVFLLPIARDSASRVSTIAISAGRIGVGAAFVLYSPSSSLPISAMVLAIVAPAGLYSLLLESQSTHHNKQVAVIGLMCTMAFCAIGAWWYWMAVYSESSYEGASAPRWISLGLLLACASPLAARSRRSSASWAWTAGLLGGAVTIFSLIQRPVTEARPVGAAPSGPRRVLVITIDTLRADALSCYEPTSPPTPNIDQLARDGALFLEAYSPAPWTLPSMASLFTGATPLVHGVSLPVENAALPTIAEYFRKAGYDTLGFFGNPILARQLGIGKVDPSAVFDYGLGFRVARFYEEQRFGVTVSGRLYADLMGLDSKRGANTVGVADQTIDRIQKQGADPLILWTHFQDPHWPYSPPPEFLPSSTPPPSMGPSFESASDVRFGSQSLKPDERHWVHALYQSEVRYVDREVGRILDTLRAKGQYDDALVVLTSDHGEEFWEHDRFGHGHSLHPEIMHVPLIIKAPRGPARRVIETPVETRALLPTLLELAAIPHQAEPFWSPSLVPMMLEGGDDTGRPPIVASGVDLFENEASIRIADLRYIRKLYSGTESLFDLSTDPGEMRSILHDRPQDAERMRRALDNTLEEAQRTRESMGLSSGSVKPFDEQTLKRLKSLGYL